MVHGNSENEHKDILKGLKSANPEKVIETIEELRIAGKTSDIRVLIELLHSSRNAGIKSKIISLLSNLKDKDSVPLIVEAIGDPKYATEMKELVSCCWENGLDYSKYLSLFVEILIGSDFLVAFEAYTVIINMTTIVDQPIIDREIERLAQAMRTSGDEKKALMLDVVDFLPSIGL